MSQDAAFHMTEVSGTDKGADRKQSDPNQESTHNGRPVKGKGMLRRFLWPPVKVLGYALFLLGAVIFILWGLDRLAEQALRRSQFGQVYPEDFSRVRRDLTMPVSHYDYDLVPGGCLVYNQTLGNRLEYANNAGFREPRDIGTDKPDDEFRILLTGGSTAFGMGAAGRAAPLTDNYQVGYRETISHMMEKILNATTPIPGKTIRVYNTAVWGHAYQHLLMRYLTKLRRYKPDLVVSLDGVNEIAPVSRPTRDWNYFEEGQYNSVLRQIFAYERAGLASYLTLWFKNNSYLMTFLWSGSDLFPVLNRKVFEHSMPLSDGKEPQQPTEFSREERAKMISANVASVVRMVENYHAALQNDGVPHMFALQPFLYLSKKPRHEMEKKVEPLEEHKQHYDVVADECYKYIVESIAFSSRHKGYFVADFSAYFDDVSEWVFADWCHLTSGANYLIAKELSNVIKERFFQKPLTDGDRVDYKDSFFWSLGMAATVVSAPPEDDSANGPRNMLSGYPGTTLYSSKMVPDDEKLEVVLDLGSEFKMSRLRLVWADEQSVPEKWAVDVSRDGQSWDAWVEASNKDLDNFSLWPGYEHYGADYVEARFVKYRPLESAERRIRLRCWSIQR
ncbi:MAG: discoidin domain-containing protein [Desulfomonilaceae bacterium]|nr:discoidin domain-containing protein [Desulfomonilaceae bacterium]